MVFFDGARNNKRALFCVALWLVRHLEGVEKMERYAVIQEKNPREIVLLRGTGCKWRRCRFCDYHKDFSHNIEENYFLNQKVLQKVTGAYQRLEVINSGSFGDLDANTVEEILRLCIAKAIHTLHIECHWRDRSQIPVLRQRFGDKGITIRAKIGLETFDAPYREAFLDKGIEETDPGKISELFDECCLLVGLPGQTEEGMTRDIETGLQYFDRVCVNMMNKNGAAIQPDPDACNIFIHQIAPHWINHPRVDVLLQNTDFGVGGAE